MFIESGWEFVIKIKIKQIINTFNSGTITKRNKTKKSNLLCFLKFVLEHKTAHFFFIIQSDDNILLITGEMYISSSLLRMFFFFCFESWLGHKLNLIKKLLNFSTYLMQLSEEFLFKM